MTPINLSGKPGPGTDPVQHPVVDMPVGDLTKEKDVQDIEIFPTNVTSIEKITLPFVSHPDSLHRVPSKFFPVTSRVNTPVQVHLLQHYLKSHPNKYLVDFVLSGFSFVFKLGLDDRVLSSSPKNNKSA